MAAANGSLSTAKLLISLGANMTSRSINGHTPLHVAVLHQHPDMIQVHQTLICNPYSSRYGDRFAITVCLDLNCHPSVELDA